MATFINLEEKKKKSMFFSSSVKHTDAAETWQLLKKCICNLLKFFYLILTIFLYVTSTNINEIFQDISDIYRNKKL